MIKASISTRTRQRIEVERTPCQRNGIETLSKCSRAHYEADKSQEVVVTAVKMANFMDLDATTAEMDGSEASESQ